MKKEYIVPGLNFEQFSTERSFATLCEGVDNVSGKFQCLSGPNSVDATTIAFEPCTLKAVAIEGVTKAKKSYNEFSAPGADGLVYICLHSTSGKNISENSINAFSTSQWSNVNGVLTHTSNSNGQYHKEITKLPGKPTGTSNWWHCQVTSFVGETKNIGIS